MKPVNTIRVNQSYIDKAVKASLSKLIRGCDNCGIGYIDFPTSEKCPYCGQDRKGEMDE